MICPFCEEELRPEQFSGQLWHPSKWDGGKDTGCPFAGTRLLLAAYEKMHGAVADTGKKAEADRIRRENEAVGAVLRARYPFDWPYYCMVAGIKK